MNKKGVYGLAGFALAVPATLWLLRDPGTELRTSCTQGCTAGDMLAFQVTRLKSTGKLRVLVHNPQGQESIVLEQRVSTLHVEDSLTLSEHDAKGTWHLRAELNGEVVAQADFVVR